MVIKIYSENPHYLSLLNKNPNTDNGLYMTQSKGATIIGFCSKKTPPIYTILVQDQKGIYKLDESNQLDYLSFCNPLIVLDVIKELFSHLLKTKEEVLEKPIPWLSKTFGKVDTSFKCQIAINYLYIDSNWIKDDVFLLEKYFEEIQLIKFRGNIYQAIITSNNIIDLINLASLLAFFVLATNKNDFRMDSQLVIKYARVLTNIPTTPYFIYYLFIKKAARSENTFEKIVNLLEQKFEQYNGIPIKFTKNDTQGDRLRFLKDHLNVEKPILNFGCGEFSLEKFLKQGTILSYDKEDFSNYYEALKGHYPKLNWKFFDVLEDIPISHNLQVVLSEVVEHNPIEEVKSIIYKIINTFSPSVILITTPNRNFNKYYSMDKEFRREDHLYEFSLEELQQFIKDLNLDMKVEYYQIGDLVGKDFPTHGIKLTK